MSKKHYIYGLFDPDTGAVRYVGRSTNPSKRVLAHVSMTQNENKTRWINELKSKGQRPDVAIIETCDETNVKEREAYWIDQCQGAGAELTNRIYRGCKPMNS